MRVDVFPTLDEDGAALVEALWRALDPVVPELDLRTVTSTSPVAVVGSVLAADATVLDLTPAPDGVHRYTTMNYPWQQEQVLAVARGYLPVNVAPKRRGGAAAYPEQRGNDEIAAWVREQLTGPLAGYRRGLGRRLVDVVLPLLGRRPSATEPAGVYVSHRAADRPAAERLRDELAAGVHHGGRRRRVVMSGGLVHSAAALPPVLRWNALAVVADLLANCTEMWVVDTPDHLGSWWTQGELVCRAYVGSVTLRSWSPDTGPVAAAPATAWLTGEQRGRLDRLFGDSHPDQLGPEPVEVVRMLRPAQPAAPAPPLLQCPRCSLPDGVPRRLDPGAFLANRGPALWPVAVEVLEECARDGVALSCPNGCGQLFEVAPLPPAYVFYQLPVGPSGSFLETVPIYRAQAAGAP